MGILYFVVTDVTGDNGSGVTTGVTSDGGSGVTTGKSHDQIHAGNSPILWLDRCRSYYDWLSQVLIIITLLNKWRGFL